MYARKTHNSLTHTVTIRASIENMSEIKNIYPYLQENCKDFNSKNAFKDFS